PAERPPAEAEPGGGGCDPPPLHVGHPALEEPEAAAADGLPAEPCDEQEARRRYELADVRQHAQRGIEAVVEAGLELLEVRADAVPRRRASRVLDLEVDRAGDEEPLDDPHRVDELRALRLAERLEEPAGELVAPDVEHVPLRATRVRESDPAHPAVPPPPPPPA